MTQPINTHLYGIGIGASQTNPFLTVFDVRDPTQDDVNYPVQKRWVNTTDNSEYILVNFSSTATNLLANWEKLASGTATTEKLQGNSGGPVSPNGSQIIFVQGDASTINVVGNPGTNTLTISAIPNATVEVLGTTQVISINTNYIANNAGLITFTLPASASQGDFFRIIGKGAGGWKVDVGTNQIIHMGEVATTLSTGSLASSNQWDSIYAFCVTAGASTVWSVLESTGNITYI